MNRDNVLFTVVGLLAGFIGGYLMHEVMAERQPAPRRITGDAVAGTASPSRPGPATDPGGAGGQPPGGQPSSMEQVQQLRAHVEANPEDSKAIRLLANLNYDIQSWQRSAELYQRYLELEPEDIDVMTDLGVVFRNLGEPQRALELFQKANALAPGRWQTRYNEILVLAFDLDQLEAANSAMVELRRLQPDNPEVARLAGELAKRS